MDTGTLSGEAQAGRSRGGRGYQLNIYKGVVWEEGRGGKAI